MVAGATPRAAAVGYSVPRGVSALVRRFCPILQRNYDGSKRACGEDYWSDTLFPESCILPCQDALKCCKLLTLYVLHFHDALSVVVLEGLTSVFFRAIKIICRDIYFVLVPQPSACGFLGI